MLGGGLVIFFERWLIDFDALCLNDCSDLRNVNAVCSLPMFLQYILGA